MTILEAFIYDPTLDLQRTKRRSNVNLQPTSVVQTIKRKIRGLLPDESIPLGVEGQVEELIKQAVDPKGIMNPGKIFGDTPWPFTAAPAPGVPVGMPAGLDVDHG